MSDYYVYALLDPRKPQPAEHCGFSFDHVPKYIGKGRGKRAQASAFYDAAFTDSPKARWVRKLANEGLEPILVFVRKGLEETESFSLEREMIRNVGRKTLFTGPLLNQSNGGEGGKHFTGAQQKAYIAKLKERRGELKVAGKLFGYNSYADHKCKIHGVVSTAPQHVLKRLEAGIPLCPVCGVQKRGPKISKHRLATGASSYKELFKQAGRRYKLVGPYTGSTVLTEHACTKHGPFNITPANVRQKLLGGLTPCPTCNLDARVPGDHSGKRRDRSALEYVELLRGAYGDTFALSGEYLGAKTSTEHKCSTHGLVMTIAGEVKKRAKRGLPGCPECGKERVRGLLSERNKLGRKDN